jgi:hypothetical protein
MHGLKNDISLCPRKKLNANTIKKKPRAPRLKSYPRITFDICHSFVSLII